MGVLDKLKIVALAPKLKRSVEHDRRVKLVEQLAEQLKIVEATLGGTAYQRSKTVWITDDVGNCSIPDDHIDPRRFAFFMARSVLRDIRSGVRTC